MRRYQHSLFIVIILLLNALCLIPAGAQEARGTISGVVRDARTQQPVAGVEVRIGPTGPRSVVASNMTFTDAKGNYTLTPVTPGLYSLSARLTTSRTVRSSSTTRMRFNAVPHC